MRLSDHTILFSLTLSHTLKKKLLSKCKEEDSISLGSWMINYIGWFFLEEMTFDTRSYYVGHFLLKELILMFLF